MKNQYNHTTGAVYQGRNQDELQSSKEANGFESNEWLTFCQARDVNLKIKKGSKGTSIFCGFQEYDKKDKKTGKMETHKTGKWATVFNRDQMEEYKPE